MNAAGPGREADAASAAGLAGLVDPAVRDLAWLLFSAALLRAQPPLAPLAEPWEDAAQLRAVIAWLTELDRAPAPLHAALTGAQPTRLGRYAETLLGWFLAHGPAARLVAANVALRHEGRTLGECDFLVETRGGRRLHWELAVKCYLHAGDGRAQLADFVGPNLRDRFDLKLAHLLDHQLRLSAREAFASLGHAGPWLAQMFVKGWLFYRAGREASVGFADAPGLAPGHARGWWVTRTAWADFASSGAADGWSVLPRLAWLAPRRLVPARAGERARVPDAGEAGVSSSGLAATDPVDPACAYTRFAARATPAAPADPASVLEGLAPAHEPAMVAAFVADGAGGYVERSRGFIVPDDWPARARVFARQCGETR